MMPWPTQLTLGVRLKLSMFQVIDMLPRQRAAGG